jgi:hypothetical protein
MAALFDQDVSEPHDKSRRCRAIFAVLLEYSKQCATRVYLGFAQLTLSCLDMRYR